MTDFFGRAPSPDFEEVLGVVELALQRKETFRGYGKGSSFMAARSREEDLHQVHEDLVLSIAEVLARATKSREFHNRFVTTLEENIRVPDIIFLTTNYDILLDNALTWLLSPDVRHLVLPDYGMDCTISREYEDSTLQVDVKIGRIPLLKLHGSLNWLFCPRCLRIDLTPYHKGGYVSAFSNNPCSCGQHRAPVVIPPTYLKDITNQYLMQVWSRAERELKEVGRLVFCGYSLPPADLQFRYLLKRVQVNTNHRPLPVFVMNGPSTDATTNGQYGRFFGETNVKYLPYKFQDFARKGLDIIAAE